MYEASKSRPLRKRGQTTRVGRNNGALMIRTPTPGPPIYGNSHVPGA